MTGVGRPPRDTETILRVARMRYDQRMSPADIAQALDISVSTVSRTLKAALDRGFVEIQVAPEGWRDADLERRLSQRFGLEASVVVQPRTPEAGSFGVLSRAVGRWLEERLVAGSVIGVSDGESVAAVADAVRSGRSTDIDVLSLIGGIGAPQIHTHSTEISRVLASNVRGRVWQLLVPAVLEDIETAESLRRIASVNAVFDIMRRTTIGLVGIGAMSPQASVFRHGMIAAECIDRLVTSGAVGSICARFYDAGGKPIASQFDQRTMAITLSDLTHVPLRIGVAAGPAKLTAIVAALRGSLVNVLATDSPTAVQLLAGDANAL